MVEGRGGKYMSQKRLERYRANVINFRTSERKCRQLEKELEALRINHESIQRTYDKELGKARKALIAAHAARLTGHLKYREISDEITCGIEEDFKLAPRDEEIARRLASRWIYQRNMDSQFVLEKDSAKKVIIAGSGEVKRLETVESAESNNLLEAKNLGILD